MPVVLGARPTSRIPTATTIIRDLLYGEYTYPVRIVVFNAIEGPARDATIEIADELA